MRIRHADKKLERLETDPVYSAGFDGKLVRSYRKVMQLIRAAVDERTFYALKSLHYEKLKGDRKHQRSMRLHRQFRLVLELEEVDGKAVIIVSIEDYH
ncbi:MAG TPA: type II toxin-antitoxin system RelE/ParE family toxin [Tepidisphaeraceae bacterium]|jgi:proteic killer suppression protein|nr:type II toxin-antitoxin system RelE/ParE family toxin [Tepidisphaeraceae bacterium]